MLKIESETHGMRASLLRSARVIPLVSNTTLSAIYTLCINIFSIFTHS